MKKLMSFILAAFMLLSFVACSGNGGKNKVKKFCDAISSANNAISSEAYKYTKRSDIPSHPSEKVISLNREVDERYSDVRDNEEYGKRIREIYILYKELYDAAYNSEYRKYLGDYFESSYIMMYDVKVSSKSADLSQMNLELRKELK